MIKQLGKHDILTTPFLTVKGWSLSNVDPQDLVLTEMTGSSEFVALEYVDYTLNDTGSLNRECNIALEQQSTDLAIPEEGTSGSGKFFPDSEPTNIKTGHFKRLVHDQTYRAFYNRYNNPLQIFGIDNIDFPLTNNNRYLANKFLMFTIPHMIFGERITENTITLYDQNFDDNIVIKDDGNGNLVARQNLFSKTQEIHSFGNTILTGSVSSCSTPSSGSCSIDMMLTLLSSSYGIQGYYDGLIVNPTGHFPYGVTWDGTFVNYFYYDESHIGWSSGEVSTLDMDGAGICLNTLTFTCISDTPVWTLTINDGGCSQVLWRGTKIGGTTPEGTYDYVSDDVGNGGPSTLIIELIGDPTIEQSGGITCCS